VGGGGSEVKHSLATECGYCRLAGRAEFGMLVAVVFVYLNVTYYLTNYVTVALARPAHFAHSLYIHLEPDPKVRRAFCHSGRSSGSLQTT